MASIFIRDPSTGTPEPEGAQIVEVHGSSRSSKGYSIWFTQIMDDKHRDYLLWSCGKCQVAFTEDWRVKHVNWHFRSRTGSSR